MSYNSSFKLNGKAKPNASKFIDDEAEECDIEDEMDAYDDDEYEEKIRGRDLELAKTKSKSKRKRIEDDDEIEDEDADENGNLRDFVDEEIVYEEDNNRDNEEEDDVYTRKMVEDDEETEQAILMKLPSLRRESEQVKQSIENEKRLKFEADKDKRQAFESLKEARTTVDAMKLMNQFGRPEIERFVVHMDPSYEPPVSDREINAILSNTFKTHSAAINAFHVYQKQRFEDESEASMSEVELASRPSMTRDLTPLYTSSSSSSSSFSSSGSGNYRSKESSSISSDSTSSGSIDPFAVGKVFEYNKIKYRVTNRGYDVLTRFDHTSNEYHPDMTDGIDNEATMDHMTTAKDLKSGDLQSFFVSRPRKLAWMITLAHAKVIEKRYIESFPKDQQTKQKRQRMQSARDLNNAESEDTLMMPQVLYKHNLTLFANAQAKKQQKQQKTSSSTDIKHIEMEDTAIPTNIKSNKSSDATKSKAKERESEASSEIERFVGDGLKRCLNSFRLQPLENQKRSCNLFLDEWNFIESLKDDPNPYEKWTERMNRLYGVDAAKRMSRMVIIFSSLVHPNLRKIFFDYSKTVIAS